MELVEFFLRHRPLSSHVQQDHVLLLKLQQRKHSGPLLVDVVDAEQVAGEVAELLVRLGSGGALVHPGLVRHHRLVPFIRVIEICSLVVQPYFVLLLHLVDELVLSILLSQELRKNFRADSSEQFLLPLGSQAVAHVCGLRHDPFLDSGVDFGNHIGERLLGVRLHVTLLVALLFVALRSNLAHGPFV